MRRINHCVRYYRSTPYLFGVWKLRDWYHIRVKVERTTVVPGQLHIELRVHCTGVVRSTHEAVLDHQYRQILAVRL